VNGSNTELALDGRNERWPLEKGTGEGLQGTCKLSFATWELVVKTNDTHVFLSSTLLGLDEAGCAIDADNKAASDLGVKSATVTGLLNPKSLLIHEQ
jgi:hypothetical protein